MSIYKKKEGSTKKPNGYWKVKENCIAEARKYATPLEWQSKSPGSFNASYRYRWFYECCEHMEPKKVQPIIIPVAAQQSAEVAITKRIESEKKVMSFLGFL